MHHLLRCKWHEREKKYWWLNSFKRIVWHLQKRLREAAVLSGLLTCAGHSENRTSCLHCTYRHKLNVQTNLKNCFQTRHLAFNNELCSVSYTTKTMAQKRKD